MQKSGIQRAKFFLKNQSYEMLNLCARVGRFRRGRNKKEKQPNPE
jgi:hypothetical protein